MILETDGTSSESLNASNCQHDFVIMVASVASMGKENYLLLRAYKQGLLSVCEFANTVMQVSTNKHPHTHSIDIQYANLSICM